MIEPLDNAAVEDGLANYLAAAPAIAALTLPAQNPEDAAGPPQIVKGLDKNDVEAHAITIAVAVPEMNQEAVGIYSPEVHLWVITPAKVGRISRDDHRAAIAALASSFPGRPGAGSADLPAWLAIEDTLSAAMVAASGWEVHGWFPSVGSYAKDSDRWEQRVTLVLGLTHPDVYASSSSASS